MRDSYLRLNNRGVESCPGGQYNDAFWGDSYGKSGGFDCEFWVAEMQGYNGIVVVLMPNGASYYYASEGCELTYLIRTPIPGILLDLYGFSGGC